MSQWYVCDYCGYEDRANTDGPPDEIQCRMCGEPVIPLTPRSSRLGRRLGKSHRVKLRN